MTLEVSDEELYSDAIDEFGVEAQYEMGIQESWELIRELIKLQEGVGSVSGIHDEIADMQVMVEQLAMMFGEEECRERYEYKKQRLRRRIEENE